jgi:hypothetical protein
VDGDAHESRDAIHASRPVTHELEGDDVTRRALLDRGQDGPGVDRSRRDETRRSVEGSEQERQSKRDPGAGGTSASLGLAHLPNLKCRRNPKPHARRESDERFAPGSKWLYG